MSVHMNEALLNVQNDHHIKSQVKIYKRASINFSLRTAIKKKEMFYCKVNGTKSRHKCTRMLQPFSQRAVTPHTDVSQSMKGV